MRCGPATTKRGSRRTAVPTRQMCDASDAGRRLAVLGSKTAGRLAFDEARTNRDAIGPRGVSVKASEHGTPPVIGRHPLGRITRQMCEPSAGSGREESLGGGVAQLDRRADERAVFRPGPVVVAHVAIA